jgi:hypothetical protein
LVLVATIGNPRTGKTLVDTVIEKKLVDKSISMGFKINQDRFYFANYHFYEYLKPLITYLNEPADLMKIKLPELYSGVTNLDELYVWLESRGSGANSINKILSHVAFQSGKSGFDILWSAQLSSSVDKRIRFLTDYFVVALTPTQTAFRYAFVSSNKVTRFKLNKIKATEFYPYYDTREKIMPLEVEQEMAVKEFDDKMHKANISDSNLTKTKDEIKNAADSLEEQAAKIRYEDTKLAKEETQETLEQSFRRIETEHLAELDKIEFELFSHSS